MKDRNRDQWERLGNNDPYWAVLSDPEKKGGKWNKAEFFKSGESEIEYVLSKVNDLGSVMTMDVALDFGCGTGRLSRSLAKKFAKVIAVDISSSMLDEAMQANLHLANISFLHNTSNDLQVIDDKSVDFIYSNIVLQHMPKKNQVAYIKEFCRLLKPRGVLVFQTPSSRNLSKWTGWARMLLGNNVLNFARKIKYGADGVMELHSLKRKNVIKILRGEGLKIMTVERYDSAGPSFYSYMYYASKC